MDIFDHILSSRIYMYRILNLIGIFVILGIAFLVSKEKQSIKWKNIATALVTQIVLALIMLKTPVWKVVQAISNGVLWIINQSTEGINFVFGGITDNYVFFINSLLPIVFISSLVGLAFHFGILQKVIKFIGIVIAKTFKIDTIVAVNLVTNMFLGQSESLFVTKSYLPNAKDSVVFATLVAGMSSISVSVMGLYVGFGANIDWIIVSLPIVMFTSLMLCQIIMPTTYESGDVELENDRGANFIDTMMNYAMSGFQGVIGISVALIVFLSIVALLNNFLGLFSQVTIQQIVGYIFIPFSYLMGIPKEEVFKVSQLLGTKLVTNEAVSFSLPSYLELTQRTKAIVTVTLCSFAGLGSVGVLIGSYAAIAKNKAKIVAKYGIKALLVSTMGSILTGCIISLVM